MHWRDGPLADAMRVLGGPNWAQLGHKMVLLLASERFQTQASCSALRNLHGITRPLKG